jgi:hypothetical protein
MIDTSDPGADFPFSPKNGALSPFLLMAGDYAVDIGDIPSLDARQNLVMRIRDWFPDVNRFHADKRLKAGSTLVNGVDESSGERLINLLKSWGIRAELRPAGARPLRGLLCNSGLLAPAVLIPVALLVRGIWGFLFLLCAILAPFIGAYFKRKQDVPVISAPTESTEYEFWRKTAEDYAQVVDRLSPADARVLESITESVFRLLRKLRTESFAAVAAGGSTGGLFSKLKETLSSATGVAARLPRADAKRQEELRNELDGLLSMIHRLSDWYAGVENGSPQAQPELAEELAGLTQTIDLIVSEVRPARDKLISKDKIRL